MESRGTSRHMACKTCRDRKVRCDGAQPACDKCRRVGEDCLYLPTNRLGKADLADMVDTLQQRLDRAEAQLQRINSAPARQQTPFGLDFAASKFTEAKSVPLNIPLSMSPDDPNFSAEQSGFLAGIYRTTPRSQTSHSDLVRSEYFNSMGPPTWTGGSDDAVRFHAGELEMIDRPRGEGINPMPSLRELREMNSTSMGAPHRTRTGSLGALGSTGMPERGDIDAVAREMKAFLSTLLTTQAEITGISNVAAEYLAWMCRSPKPGNVEILQALESRLREIQGMAEPKTWASYKNLIATLDLPGGQECRRLKSSLGDLAEEYSRQRTELESFFSNNYSISTALTEQRRPATGESEKSLED